MTDYNIVALGPPGSGKTVFLATLYNSIVSGRLAKGVRVSLSVTAASWLDEVYRQVASPRMDWPPGTDPDEPMREVDMHFFVQRLHKPFLFGAPTPRSYSAFTIKYVDYAGEWITEGHKRDPELLQKFQTLLESADMLFCFLDGQRLLRLLLDPESDTTFIEDELRPAIRFCANHDAPVIIVVTKWDLLGNRLDLHGLVRILKDRSLTELAALAETRSDRMRITGRKIGGVWLIPVSATGPDFVRITPKGKVEKVGQGTPEPRNISVPLTTGLVEISKIDFKRFRKGKPQAGGLSRVQHLIRSGVDAGVSGDARKWAAFAGELSVDVVRWLSWPAVVAVRRTRRQVRRFEARGVDGVKNEESAFMYIAHALQVKLKGFQKSPDYDAANLWSDGEVWDIR